VAAATLLHITWRHIQMDQVHAQRQCFTSALGSASLKKPVWGTAGSGLELLLLGALSSVAARARHWRSA
jgi:hypothetical protein